MKVVTTAFIAVLALATASAAIASPDIIRNDISILQAVKIGNILTGSAKLSAPLTVVFDDDGAAAGNVVGWTDESDAQLRALLEMQGTKPALGAVLAELGLEVEDHGGPTILTVSLGEACEPCKKMDLGVAAISRDFADATVVQLTVNTSQGR